MTQGFLVPGKLPGMNDFEGGRRWGYRTAKKKWEEIIGQSIIDARLTKMDKVFIEFQWFEMNRRRNPDNFSSMGRKFIIDSLVKSGVIKNDGWGEILGWSDKWKVEKFYGVQVILNYQLEGINKNKYTKVI